MQKSNTNISRKISIIGGTLVMFFVSVIFAANIWGSNKYAEDPYGGILNLDVQDDYDSNSVGGITVLDDQITGQIWGQNFGWLEMQPTGITGTSVSIVLEDIDGDQTDEIIGRLSGYAWSDVMGPVFMGQWDEDNIDLDNDDSTGVDQNTGVYIDSDGYFQGIAWSKHYGGFAFGDMMLENSETNAYTDPDDATDVVYDKTNYWARTDWVPNIVEFTLTASSGSETITPVLLEVSVPNAPTNQNVTVDYAATGGTATGSGTDYTLASGTATITSGNTTTVICLGITNDGDPEPDETIEITLSNPTNAVLGTNTLYTYTIEDEDGALTLDIVDDLGDEVLDPQVIMSGITTNFQNQVSTGSLGVSTQKIRLSNTTQSNEWSVSIAATNGNTEVWSDGTDSFDYNDVTAGQLTLDPSLATVVRDDSGSIAGISLGGESSFLQGTLDSITLFSSTTAANMHHYDLTGIQLSQFVPSVQADGDYVLNLMITVI